VSLRAKIVLYLVAIHLIFGTMAVFWLREERAWLLGVEVCFALSLAMGVRLVRHFWVPLELVRTGAELIEEGDFTSRFAEVGQPEMDRLVRVYNRMIDRLREERVRSEEQHYFMDRVLHSAPVGVLTLDFDERIVLANPAAERLLQAGAAELVGKKLGQLSSPLAQALDGLEAGEARVFPLQGRRRVRCQTGRFLDRGFPRCFLLMEELTEELRKSERDAYEKVIRLLAHEVNNSVGAINSLLHSCLKYQDQLRKEDRPDFGMAVEVAINRTDHLNAFMGGFAGVFKLPPPRFQPVDLQGLLKDVESLLSAESRQRRIEWAWEEQEPPGPVPMDRGQMEQVLVNVLKNAMEAIGHDGRITIRLGKRDGHSWVAIEDTGGGIKPELRAQLFTPFFSTKENGQGLGLTLVQEILERHGFDFSLDSRPGGPTQFEIVFRQAVGSGAGKFRS
jgi:nitrogen fixation/metabolism regulation signal transduction histidine kinase